jgi:hypothetical protein
MEMRRYQTVIVKYCTVHTVEKGTHSLRDARHMKDEKSVKAPTVLYLVPIPYPITTV